MKDSTRSKLNKYSKIILVSAILLGLTSIILEHGFYFNENINTVLHNLTISVLAVFVAYQFFQLFISENKTSYLKKRKIEFIITFLILLELIIYLFDFDFMRQVGIYFNFKDAAFLYIIIAQVFIVVRLILGGLRYNLRILASRINPAKLFIFSFLLTISFGTIFLLLPKASINGSISFVDALFTSTSAVCVTGLITLDTATEFTRFGQTVILLLVQIGGLGLVTFTTFFAIFLSGGLGLRESILLQDILGEENIGKVSKVLYIIITVTFTIEFIGAVLLYMSISSKISNFGDAVFNSVFHSVSSFCNAGFSIYTLNLFDPAVKSNYLYTSTVAILIVIGGIGFPTLMNIFSNKFFNKIPEKIKNRLTLQTKIILITSFVLILFGALGTYLLEFNHSLKNLDLSSKIYASFFQSISTRTAGFNTVSINEISNATSIFYNFLMFIGASPGGTGGGIKTTTFVIMIIAFGNFIANKRNVKISNRSIPNSVVMRAFLKGFISLLIIAIGIFLLSITDYGLKLNDIIFEVFSAFGTVGLSKGITAVLSVAGKYIIILLMFIGRIGPITFMNSLVNSKKEYDIDYPSEEISTI